MGMGAPKGTEEGALISEINITPMVDVMLVLLIIFMVTAPAMFMPAIDLEMPEAATAENQDSQEFGVLVDRSGQWYLNGKPTTKDGLVAAVEKARANNQDPVVLVGADRKVPYEQIMELLDFLRENGVFKFALNTVQPGTYSDGEATDQGQ